jgi:putative mRNA 3-end processing factor
MRLGSDAQIESLEYKCPLKIGQVNLSLHPAGHMLGSAQVRLEHAGEVWVVSGDYKLAPDATCRPWEPVPCHVFATEAIFGLPIFRWPGDSQICDAIHAWWRANQEAGRVSLLFADPFGKAQRLLSLIDTSIGPILTHEAVEPVNEIYRAQGVRLPLTTPTGTHKAPPGALIIAPPEAHGSAWARRLGLASTALASGWMRIRGTRRRRSLDRGFVLSDHAGWPDLLRAIEETWAEAVWVTSGFRGPLVRWLEEHGRNAVAVETRFGEPEA